MPKLDLPRPVPLLPTHQLVAQLHAGYSEQATLYQMLFGLTSRQRRSLGDGGDLAEFVELAGEKDRLLSQISALDGELESLRSQWMQSQQLVRESVTENLSPVFDEIIHAIQRTVSVEKDNERLLEQRRKRLSRLLTDAQPWRGRAATASRREAPAWASPVAAVCLSV
jgi:hypothetical protein